MPTNPGGIEDVQPAIELPGLLNEHLGVLTDVHVPLDKIVRHVRDDAGERPVDLAARISPPGEGPDEEEAVTVGITGLAAALPGLIADDQSRYNPSDAVDPYCSAVFDLTHW